MSSLKKRATSHKNSQGSLKKGGKDSRPEFKLVDNDPTTNKLLGLKDVKFLNTESKDVLSQTIDANEVQKKTGLMAEAYLKKQQNVASNVQKIIDRGKVAQMEIYRKSIAEKEAEDKARDQAKRNQSPGMANLMNSLEQESPAQKDDKIADGFVRSKRNLAMRAKDNINDGMQEIEEERNKLHDKLNQALIRLDSLNHSKKEMQEKLVEQIKFVRDLQKATGGAGLDDLNSILSSRTREEYKRQKEMKAQLEHQLSRAERERQELLDRIKLLTGEKEVVVVNVNGQRKTYRVTTVNIERLINELREFKGECHHHEHAIEQTRSVLIQIDDELYQQERQLQALRHERDHLFDKVAECSVRQDEAVVCLEGEKRRMMNLHKMHIKLLATRLFEETFQKIVKKTVKPYFEHAKIVIAYDLSRMKALFNFRKMIWVQDRRKSKKNLQKWYQLALKPTRIIKANCTLPIFFNRKEQLAYFYQKWRAEFRKKSKQFAQNDRGFSRIITVWNKIEVRRQQRALIQWRRFMFAGNDAIKGLMKLFNFKEKLKIQNAFKTWHTQMVEQDFSVRMQALCIQVGLKMLTHKVLLAWKQQITYEKMINRHRKLRAFKNLKVLVDRRKIIGQLSSKKFHFAILKYRQQVCFNQLRWWKEEKKLIKVMAILTGEIEPKLANWKNQIICHHTLSRQRMLRRAIRILVINPFGKSLSQVIQQWKQAAIVKKYQSKYNLKSLLIRLYHTKQKVGFDRWRLCYAFQANAAQVKKIQNLQIDNGQLEGAIKEELNQIEIKNHEIKSMASKRLRKLVIMAFERNLHHFLIKWNEGCQDQRAKQDAAALIQNKIRQRMLRIALTLYKRGVRICVQDSYNIRRIEEVQARLATRNKKRIMRAWMNFTANHHNATRFLANLVKNIDAHNKIRTFKNWKKFTIFERESALFVEERGVVEKISDHQDNIGILCDKLNENEIFNKRLKEVLQTQGRKVIQKWVERFHNGGKNFGFQTWKQSTINLLHRGLFVQSVRRHLVLNTYRQAMERWQQAIFKDNQNKLAASTTETEKGTEAVANSIAFIRRMGQKNRKENEEQLIKVNETIRCETKKIQNTISALIRRQDHYHHMKRSRYILHQWYRYTNTRKKCVQAMVNGINKIFLQFALSHIRQSQYKVDRKERREAAAYKLLNISTRFDTRICMNRWRLHVVRCMNFKRGQFNRQEQWHEAMNNEWLVKVQNHRRFQGAVERRNQKQYFLFDSWRKVTFDLRVIKDQKEKLQQRIEFYQKKRMLLKWYTRKHNCDKLRRHVRLLKQKRHKIWLGAVWKALKYQFKVKKDLCVSVARALDGKMFEQKLCAFQSIVCRAQINNNLTLNSKLQACSVLVERMGKLRHKNLSISILNISESHTKNYKFQTLMHQLLSSQKARQLRIYIARWRNNIQFDDIKEELNNGQGRLNVECWNLRMKMFNLIDMCGYDRATEKQITQVLLDEKKRYRYLMEKSICRFLVYKDDILYLMPYCLDRLRSYCTQRKMWRLVLNRLNRRATHIANKSEMYMALKTWKIQCDQKVFKLAKIPIEELVKRSCQNSMKLINLADSVQDGIENIQEYTDQRDMLFKGYISGQKLAVSLGINNHKIAQQKAIMNLSDHGNLKLQSRIGEALHMNLQKISELKDTIADYEVRNELLAESNDSFRIGALDAVSFARQIEDLQRDRDRLQQELHDRSGTIRKLLEDNQYLSYRIQDARKNSKEQIEKQTMIAHRQQYEREQMRQAERENLSTVHNGQSTGKGPFSPMRIRSPRRNN